MKYEVCVLAVMTWVCNGPCSATTTSVGGFCKPLLLLYLVLLNNKLDKAEATPPRVLNKHCARQYEEPGPICGGYTFQSTAFYDLPREKPRNLSRFWREG